MYDTIEMRTEFNTEQESNDFWNNIENIARNDDTLNITPTHNGGSYKYSAIKGMHIKTWGDRFLTVSGSLPKLLYGNNIQTLTREDTREGIGMLSNTFSYPFDTLKITRIDFATNLIMDYTPESYFQYLADYPRLQRKPEKHGMYFLNKSRCLAFYNKTAECIAHEQAIPKELEDRNILRYELRYYRPLIRGKKLKITARQLHSEDFYNSMIDNWVKSYFKIKRISPNKSGFANIMSIADMEKDMTPKQIEQFLLERLYKCLGTDNILRFIEDMKRNGIISNQSYASNYKNKVIQACQSRENSEDGLIHELDTKIKDAANDYR